MYYIDIINHTGVCNSVGIATGYEVYGPVIDSRWGLDFSALVQTGPGAYPAFCTMGRRWRKSEEGEREVGGGEEGEEEEEGKEEEKNRKSAGLKSPWR